MDQIKIGRFIALCRKDIHLTQAELAEKLGITNRAVSKWENGRCVPDASVMLELCELLHINVNELLCGKRLNEEEERRYADRNTLTMLVARRELDNLHIATELLIFAGIVITITLTSVLAVSALQKAVTLLVGCFVWGYGLWMRIRLGKALKKID